MAVVYLVRHGEPEVKGVFLGRLDPALACGAGEHLVKSLAQLEVDVTYCSSQRRARQTATYLRSRQTVVTPDLCEIDYGLWTGKTWAEVETEWPALAAEKSADWLGVTPPGGESWAQVLERVRPLSRQLLDSRKTAAVVAHQGVNAALASLLAGCDPLAFAQQYGEVISVSIED